MRNVNASVLSASDNASTNGSQIDAGQLVASSFHAYFGDARAAGTFKLQASNTPGNVQSNTVAANWVDIPNQSATISAGGSALLTIANMAYRWIRAVYTTTANFKQVQTVATVADVAGSLNSTYFLVSSINAITHLQKNFYVWYDDGAGVDPAVPGKTGVQVVYADDDSANTIATLTRAALNALTNDFVVTGATNQVIITLLSAGPVTVAADGTAATGFGFTNTNPGITPTTINVNMNALSA